MSATILIVILAATLPRAEGETPAVRTELARVVLKPLAKTTKIPGELKAYQRVDIHAKVTGFVEAIHVDRGSFVETGQVLAEMSAPELEAQRVECSETSCCSSGCKSRRRNTQFAAVVISGRHAG